MLTAHSLDQNIKILARHERETLARLLPLIRALDECHGYLEFQCTSLFEYLVKRAGYSEGSAQRRIDAARLLPLVPGLLDKLETGAIKLTQVSLVKRGMRQSSKPVSSERVCRLMQSLEGQNQRQSEKLVAEAFELAILKNSTRRTQADGSVRIELTLTAELAARIQQAQELLSHELKSTDLTEFLELVTAKLLKTSARKSTATAAVTPKLRREAISQPCAHIYPDGTRCANRWQMQVDHKLSRWRGGGHRRENLQALCAQHNRLKYKRERGGLTWTARPAGP